MLTQTIHKALVWPLSLCVSVLFVDGSCACLCLQVSKPVIDNVLNCLRIEVSDITITLSAR